MNNVKNLKKKKTESSTKEKERKKVKKTSDRYTSHDMIKYLTDSQKKRKEKTNSLG